MQGVPLITHCRITEPPAVIVTAHLGPCCIDAAATPAWLAVLAPGVPGLGQLRDAQELAAQAALAAGSGHCHSTSSLNLRLIFFISARVAPSGRCSNTMSTSAVWLQSG